MLTYSVTYKYFKFCALLLLSFTHALLSSADIWSTDHRYLKCIYRMSRFQFDSKCSQTIINIATFCVGHIPATCMKLPWFIWRPILFETTSIVLYVCKSFHHSRNNPAATTTRCSPATAEIRRARKCSSESLTRYLLDSDSTQQRPGLVEPWVKPR